MKKDIERLSYKSIDLGFDLRNHPEIEILVPDAGYPYLFVCDNPTYLIGQNNGLGGVISDEYTQVVRSPHELRMALYATALSNTVP